MQNAFVDGFVDHRNGRVKKFYALRAVAAFNGGAKPFDLRSQFSPIAAVYRATFFILPDTLFG
jgi:hypothetical protein